MAENVCLGNRTQIANAVGFGNCSARALYPGESCTQAPHGGYKCSPSTCSYSPYVGPHTRTLRGVTVLCSVVVSNHDNVVAV